VFEGLLQLEELDWWRARRNALKFAKPFFVKWDDPRPLRRVVIGRARGSGKLRDARVYRRSKDGSWDFEVMKF